MLQDDMVQQPRHAPKPSMNGDLGAPRDNFHIKQPSMSAIRERQAAAMPNINTSRAGHGVLGMHDLQTPGTGYDMNFTPLLPSQLLMGSPFQPGSPTFQTPQFQSFPTFTPQANQGQQQQQNMGHQMQNQQPMSPELFQSMISPTTMGGPQGFGQTFVPQQHQQQQQGGYQNMGGGYANNMQMGPGLMSGTSRTVYLGNIPPETSPEEILGHVRSGQIESVRLLQDKNCAFISFLDTGSAVHFHSDAILKKLAIRGQDIKIGWGKPSQVPSSVALAIQQSGASRNVYLGNLPAEMTEDDLREELGKFGPIDTVKVVREKNIGFIHFLSISNAIKAVAQLPNDPNWQAPRRVFYGKDRCAYVSKTQQQNAAQYLGIAPGYAHMLNATDKDMLQNAFAQQSVQAATIATAAGGVNNLGNRTVYLGNIHPETTAEEICNVVRGGLLHHIRYIPDKHICFVTFIDPSAAANFFLLSSNQGLMIHNRRLKVGWGKHSGALPPAIALAVSGGASRNVYIGNIDESWSEDRLRQDFAEYGEIELVNALREKSCAFVNFTNIANAIKAIEAIRGKDEYKRFKINFGKDRCGNPPRQNNHNHHAQMQQQQQNSHANQDFLGSPTVNGSLPFGQSGPSSDGSHSNPLMSPNHLPNQMHQMQNGFGGNGNNGTNAYFNQMGSYSQGQNSDYGQTPPPFQSFQKPQNGHNQSNSPFGSVAGITAAMGRSNLDVQQPQHFQGHGSSNSFSVAAGGAPPNTEGLLNPTSGLSAAQRAQHARAVSLPAFSQGPFAQNPHGQQGLPGQQMQNNAFGGLGAGLSGLGNGVGANGYGLAIQGDGGLPRWAEEEVV